MNRLVTGLALAGVAGASIAGYVIGRSILAGSEPTGRTVQGGDVEAWIASGRLRTPPADRTGMRVVPIIARPTLTPLYDAAALPPGNGPETYAALLQTLRGYAANANEPIDMRVLWCLWTDEVGARGDGCKEHNAGCVHADALIWCSRADAREGRVWTRNDTMRGVYLGRDGGTLPFSAWQDFASFTAYTCGLFRNVYPEAWHALRTGGRESLDGFAHGLVFGRSGSYMDQRGHTQAAWAAAKATDYRNRWDARARRAGTAWTR